MSDGEDFLYRPVLAGMMPESALWDNTVDLYRFVLANEALDVQAENRARIHDHMTRDDG